MPNLSYIQKAKNNYKLTMISVYDYLFASIFDGEVDILLVGDSLSMSFGGHKDTIAISLDNMIYHSEAVCKGAQKSFVVVDLPFGSYTNEDIALRSAIRIYKLANVDAVKLEGGANKAHIVRALTQENIAVMGHIGLKPQSVRLEGGYKIKGKDEEQTQSLIKDAKALQEAGAFCIVLECIDAKSASMITNSIDIPTIGIGSGVDTDGQVLVWSDMLGFCDDLKPKFVRKYLNGSKLVKKAIKSYASDVLSGNFPSPKETY